MKHFRFLLTVLFLSLTFAEPLAAKNVEYTGKNLRDPFSELPELKTNDAASFSQDEKIISSLVLQGVSFSPGGPRAIISGIIAKVGDKKAFGEIKRITPDGVTIVYNGKEFILKPKGRKPYAAPKNAFVTKN